ncbi:hypothetical protein [Pedobacter frigidisoli]|uniref:hypothetical protein n=1 Tax=Pedobacter frigidisoli TaxID=2530455 RepID=UPI00292E8D83|nr:hypothetical protein [Pedobacter frigidisoli]
MKKYCINGLYIGCVRHSLLLGIGVLVLFSCAFGQTKIRDESMINQQERMVFKSWDRSKFTPTSGFLGLNPYYWLTWGLHPNYPKTDLRPLSLSGHETLRLGLEAGMQSSDKQMELGSDTIRNVALDQISAHAGLFSDADPLWLLYYSAQFRPVTDPERVDVLGGLPPAVKAKLISEGSYGWYNDQVALLAERLEGSRRTNQDRGSRIVSYQRLLLEFRKIQGIWSSKRATAEKMMRLSAAKLKVGSGSNPGVPVSSSDVEVAKKVLSERKF